MAIPHVSSIQSGLRRCDFHEVVPFEVAWCLLAAAAQSCPSHNDVQTIP
jgi:hypothetical protein